MPIAINGSDKTGVVQPRQTVPRFFRAFLKNLRKSRERDIAALCRQLISELGEASQTVLAQELIVCYEALDDQQRLEFFQMLCRDFGPDESLISKAAGSYHRSPSFANYQGLAAAMVTPLQKLFQRMNTAPRGTETLVSMRGRVVRLLGEHAELIPLDSELRYLFGLWFNRGFLRLERIGWQTSALVLEKLIEYESVHEVNGWSDLRRRLAPDRRCFAFFHPALANEPVIFVEIALTQGLAGELAPLLDVDAPVLEPEQADSAVFYSISNCLHGLRGISFGNFLIKQVVMELGAELPGIRMFGTLSPLTRFARALHEQQNREGFTRHRLSRLLSDYAERLAAESGKQDAVEALFFLLRDPLVHREVLSKPLHRLALAYLTQARENERVYDPVASFHLANGARLERINLFSNLRPYGLTQSFGLTANYRYVPDEVEENHESFVRDGEIRVSSRLLPEQRLVAELWK